MFEVRMVASVAMTAVVALGGTASARDGAEPTREAGEARGEYWMRASDTFAPPGTGDVPDAVTYDERAVPPGATIEVGQREDEGGTTVELVVAGVAENRVFGAHVHTGACGPAPDDSGPHYQHRKDPVQPSVDPKYASEQNEVWLDFRTDDRGRAEQAAWHDWGLRKGEARSVVLHEHATDASKGNAGQAGDRLACFTVPFGMEPRSASR